MNIGIVHGFVGGGGGTEKTLLAIIELFVEREHKVTLYTFSKPSINIPGIHIKSIIPFRLPLFGLYQRYYEKNLIKHALNDDLIIQASGGLAFPTDPKKHVIVYCHHDFQNEFEKNVTKYQGLWSVYYKPYAELSKNINTLIQNKNIHLIANSNFTHSSIKSKYDKDSTVIYPPVDLSEFENVKLEKKKQVITISRFSPEKNLIFALQVIEKLDTNYLLIGNTKTKTTELYFNKLKSKINSQKLRTKVDLLKNISRNELINYLKTSKIYFHSSPETFGISVIEAIAAGCIPIVPDDSANKETVKFDQLRYSPNNVEDACKKISQGLSGEFDNLTNALRHPLLQFSKNSFKNNFKKYLDKELSISI
jgi:glycosyltransferase involved in cell wall biosynthesis